MSLTEIMLLVIEMQRENKGLRAGQCVFNIIYEIDPVIADRFRGTDVDPFYDDSRIDAFLAACGVTD